MHNYLGYLPDGLEPRSRFAQPSSSLPTGFIDELNAGRKVGVWWVQPQEVAPRYRVIGRTVVERMDTTRYGNVENLVMHPDLSASFGCASSVGKQVIAGLREFDLTASRLSRLDDNEHRILAHAVMATAPVRIGRALTSRTSDAVASPDPQIIKNARRILQNTLRKPVNDPGFFDKEDTRGVISGVGLHVMTILQAEGQDEASALAAILEIDPVMAGAGPMPIPLKPVGQPNESRVQVSDLADIDFPRQRHSSGIVGSEEDENTDYELISPESLNARTFSEPTCHKDTTPATQRAEDVHQQMLKKIYEYIVEASSYECRFNPFADMVLIRRGQRQPDHIMEIKSITTDNLEPQISKGIIQLARRQHAHRMAAIRYHLVVEMSGRPIPAYLASIARRMDIEIHLFNNTMYGQEACHTLFKAVIN